MKPRPKYLNDTLKTAKPKRRGTAGVRFCTAACICIATTAPTLRGEGPPAFSAEDMFAALGFRPFAPSDPQTELLDSARRTRLQGNYAEAAKLYGQFAQRHQASARLYEARFWLAKCLLADQKFDAAARAFTDFLQHHSDQRMYSQQAKEDRIYCWKLRYGKNAEAAPGLKAALADADASVRIQAALALAENKDATGRKVLEEGLSHPKFGGQCTLGLWKLGVRDPKTDPPTESWARMMVIRVKSDQPGSSFEMRLPINLIKNLGKLIPQDALAELERIGAGGLIDEALSAPKGQVLFEYKSEDGKTKVVLSVD